ncbi:hypothetical protein [Bacillus benzoevorans]|uniref:N-formylglutamate amidohydrolase n=1 Tax=Bacillus benzoevorans TaxID=1456 RepID=A0A7X0LWI3_9BACI|nr:hypothetical protein [Bacillus benzoevorans]MBB6445379.1 hypothetical protein [Bacillus benzoevorans]
MSIQFQKLDYIQFFKGNGKLFCQVDAQHAKGPQADLYTGKIVGNLVRKTGCAGIISIVSRTVSDLNRKEDGQNNKAIQQYRKTINEILQYLQLLDREQHRVVKPFLHLTIHGMKDEHYGPYGIEIGTLNGLSCSREMKKWLQKTITAKAKILMPQLSIQFDQLFHGDESIVYHRLGDGVGYMGYGSHFHTFQIELSRTLREKHQTEMVGLLSQVILTFQTEIAEGKRK